MAPNAKQQLVEDTEGIAEDTAEEWAEQFSVPFGWEEVDADDKPEIDQGFFEDGHPDDVNPQWCIAEYRHKERDAYVSVWLLRPFEGEIQPYFEDNDADRSDWGDTNNMVRMIHNVRGMLVALK